MAEIRLICPGCAAEYRLPGTAIPAEGREVECSACGNVWHATAQPARPLPAGEVPHPLVPGGEPPRLSRRLPDTVLDILRDEVEHERRLRAAEDGAPPPLPATPAAPPPPAAEPEWPATTITRHVGSRPLDIAPLPARPRPEPALSPPAPVPPAPPEAARSVPQPEAALQDRAATPAGQPVPPASVPMPVRRPAPGGYGAGFGLAAMLAAACLALYVLAPTLSDRGALGKGLMQLRGQADEARLWLQDRATGLSR